MLNGRKRQEEWEIIEKNTRKEKNMQRGNGNKRHKQQGRFVQYGKSNTLTERGMGMNRSAN